LEPLFSSQRRFFDEVGKRGTEAKPEPAKEPVKKKPGGKKEPVVAEKAKTTAEMKAEVHAAREQIDTELEAKTKALGSQKAKLKRSRRKNKLQELQALEDQWQEAKDEASKKRQEVTDALEEELKTASDYGQQQQDQADQLKRIREKQEQQEKGVTERDRQKLLEAVEQAGGFDKVQEGLEKQLRGLEGRRKRTKEANRWKIDPTIKRVQRDLAELNELRESKPVSEAPTKEAKQPWEMTKAEAADQLIPEDQPIETPQFWADKHKGDVKAAMERGETIPPEVLADYPDLASKPAKPVETTKINEKKAKKAHKEREAAEKEILKESRQKVRKDAANVNYFRQLVERAKQLKAKKKQTIKIDKDANKGKVERPYEQVEGETWGDWGIAKVRDNDGLIVKGKEGGHDLIHLPTGVIAQTFRSPGHAKQFAVMLEESGANYKTARIDGNRQEAKKAQQVYAAFNSKNLADVTHEDLAGRFTSTPVESGITADVVLDSYDLGQHGVATGMKSDGVETVKQLVAEVPEFAYDPVFVVDQDRNLVFRDHYTFKFPPSLLNLHPSEVEPGQTVGVNLPDLGLKLETNQAAVVVAVAKNDGYKAAFSSKKGSVTITAHGHKFVAEKVGGKWSVRPVRNAESVLEKKLQRLVEGIRWDHHSTREKIQIAAKELGSAPKPEAEKPSDKATKPKTPKQAPQTKLQQAADKAPKDAKDETAGLNKALKNALTGKGPGGMKATMGGNAEIAVRTGKVVAKFAKAGVLKFRAFLEQMVEIIGQAKVDRIMPTLESEWTKLQESGEFPGMEPIAAQHPEEQAETPPPDGIEVTSIKKAVVNDLRGMVGLPEVEGPLRQSLDLLADIAATKLSVDPRAAERLVNELASTPRAINEHDVMLLQFHYRKLANELEPIQNEYFEAVESKEPVAIATARTAVINARKTMTEFEEIIRPSKSTWGRTGRALQEMFRRDFSREGILRRGQEANHGEPLSSEQTDELLAMAKKLEDLQKQFDEKAGRVDELERELASKKQHEDVVKESKRDRTRAKSTRRQAAEKKVDNAWAEFNKAISGRAGSAVPLDLLPSAIKVATAYAELGVVRFGEFMSKVRKKAGADADEKLFREAWEQVKASGDVVEPDVDMGDRPALTKEAHSIQRALVEEGMTDREEVIDAVHEAMQEFLPDLTRRQTMDALSRYGQFSQPSQETLDKLIRDMNAEVLKLTQIDQMEKAIKRAEELRTEGFNEKEIGDQLAKENLLVEATGRVRDDPNDPDRLDHVARFRRLTADYNELKKSIPATAERRAGKLQTAQDAIVRSLENRIRDVKWELKNEERIVRERKASPDNARIRALRVELEEWMEQHREMFPPQRKQMTPEQKLAAAERGAKRMLEVMQKQEKAGFPPAAAKEAPQSSPELEATRQQIAKIRKRRDAAQREGKRVAALDELIATLEERLRTGAIAPKARPTPYSTPMIEARIARRKQLQAELEARQASEMPELAEARARKSYEASLRKRIADYKQTLADGNFAPKAKKEPRKLSQAELKLKREMEDVRHQALQKFAEYHLAHLSGIAWTADRIGEVAHLSRAIMTSFELSGVLRQGGLIGLGRPNLAKDALFGTVASVASTLDLEKTKAFRDGFTKENLKTFLKTIDSRQAEFDFMHNLNEGKWGEFRLNAGLALTGTDEAVTRQEEVIQGRWGRHIPGIAISQRTYTMILNKLRADLFDIMTDNLGRGGKVTPEEAKIIAGFVNVASGRANFGSLKGLDLNQAASILNMVFFAPRYVASRFQYLAMPFYLPFKGGLKANWRVKRAIYKEYGRTATGISVVLGIVALAATLLYDDDDEDKPTVEIDSRSSDWFKLKFGDTRLDFMAGLSQTFVLLTRMVLGQTKSSVSGKITDFGEGWKPKTRLTTLAQFGRTKLAPIPGAIATMAHDWTNVVGGKETPLSLGVGLVTPLYLRDVVETMVMRGIPQTTVLSTLGFLGWGMNTYGPKTKYVTGTARERSIQFENDLERMQWDSGPPPYNEFLTPDQMKDVDDRRENRKRAVMRDVTRAKPERKKRESNKNWTQRLELWQKQQETFGEMKKGLSMSYEDAEQLLKDYYGYLKVDETTGEPKGSHSKDNNWKPGYKKRRKRLKALYGVK